MLVETTESAERDDRLVRHANHIAQVLLHIDERNVTEVLAVALVHRAGGEINTHEIVEHQGLRRLCELHAVVRQRVLRRVEYLAELFPLHRLHPLLQLSIQHSQTEALPADLVAKVGQIRLPIQFEHMWIADHLGIPALFRHLDARL